MCPATRAWIIGLVASICLPVFDAYWYHSNVVIQIIEAVIHLLTDFLCFLADFRFFKNLGSSTPFMNGIPFRWFSLLVIGVVLGPLPSFCVCWLVCRNCVSVYVTSGCWLQGQWNINTMKVTNKMKISCYPDVVILDIIIANFYLLYLS